MKIDNLLKLLSEFDKSLVFKIAEIGANSYGNKEEPFHKLLDFFPDSQILAFEVDKNECDKLNKSSKKGIKFFPNALGKKKENRKFYETNHPMCSSLYEPNEKLLRLYNNFSVAYLKNITEIKTISLDDFIKEQNIGLIDFIKIDIQGAELDVFHGATKSLKKSRSKLPLDIDYSIGNTEELVKNSSLVLLHASTAVSYAILFKKPTIFLTSYNLRKSWMGPRINNLAKVVNGQIINMDNDLNKPLDLQNLLKIDESKYKNYLDQYLKVPNSPDVPLWEIFTNYIKSNQFGK